MKPAIQEASPFRGTSSEGAILPGPSFYSRLARLSSVVLVIPSSMVAGFLFGRFVFDRFLSTSPWGTIGFSLLGAVVGFYELWQILITDQRSNND